MTSSLSRNKNKIGVALILSFVFLAWNKSSSPAGGTVTPSGGTKATLRAGTWNIAAINNNPFEYWTTLDNEDYNLMMANVEKFITETSNDELLVKDIFTQNMFDTLFELMKQANYDQDQMSKVKAIWENDLSKRKSITEFLKDDSIGEKRLTSMPDRVSNTIHLADGNVVNRPSVINCYSGDFSNFNDFWDKWTAFMFRDSLALPRKSGTSTVASMILPISKVKYPLITEAEAAISVPLQVLYLAIFDSVLVNMMNQIAKREWQPIRHLLCQALNQHKNDRLLEIIKNQYHDLDVLFLQEVATSFIKKLGDDERLSEVFHIATPEKLGKRDQNSIMLLNKQTWKWSSRQELTAKIVFEAKVPVSAGDVFALEITTLDGKNFVLASFHGDTNGMATIPVLGAVNNMIQQLSEERGSRRPIMLFGMDANTYSRGKAGKTQDVTRFAQYFTSIGINSCWGHQPDPYNPTTHNARTFLQPQLNKGATRATIKAKGDHNPKDFILFYDEDLVPETPVKDNSGEGSFDEDLVFPTPTFPSDHAILSVKLNFLLDQGIRGGA